MTALLPGVDVSRETLERLETFSELLTKWTARINLIAPGTVGDVWQRHVIDSAQLFPLAPPDFSHWADLGAGGGLPGLVMAIIAAEKAPAARFTLVESDKRKATFLRQATREISLTARILDQRIEAVPPLAADVISARALKPLPELLTLLTPHLAPGGRAILPKGRRAEEELAEAATSWHFDLIRTPSMTDPDATLLTLERIRRA
ncbi:16S rRNA (guanine(527)-N(7))-methyltransferase RsmG [Pseudoroseicyclus tamaricis]|uniref:Ribosomal RNA small subunit methyltransferase G n=1 Tax=Pseudoroseicyclus tamaricis TaxID=2705421 RepID=A0A6B2K2I1_9RHOB|nr:16S rRNA (guanine(527)-N(7))-methyltransferase RsmG [Pseudoroseicyclus tamaricis]NDV02774.1 16S rRNA (guanine(527)-N(7))-methyltransferase RsmG [Pseudoroseicyclus tamaricis]